MYKILFLALVFFIAPVSYAQKAVKPTAVVKAIPAENTAVPQNWLSYTDTANNITVKYPGDWTLKTSNPKVVFVLTSPLENNDDKFRENINLIVRSLPGGGEGVTLKDISDAVESKIPQAVDNFKLQYSKTVKWQGADAKEVSYGGNDKSSGTAINFIQRIAINQGRMVVVTYTCAGGKDDIYKATALQVINGIVCN
jgi:hypothetical protein